MARRDPSTRNLAPALIRKGLAELAAGRAVLLDSLLLLEDNDPAADALILVDLRLRRADALIRAVHGLSTRRSAT